MRPMLKLKYASTVTRLYCAVKISWRCRVAAAADNSIKILRSCVPQNQPQKELKLNTSPRPLTNGFSLFSKEVNTLRFDRRREIDALILTTYFIRRSLRPFHFFAALMTSFVSGKLGGSLILEWNFIKAEEGFFCVTQQLLFGFNSGSLGRWKN